MQQCHLQPVMNRKFLNSSEIYLENLLVYFKATTMKWLLTVQIRTLWSVKHPLPCTRLFLITPSKQHLGTKELVSLSPLHTAIDSMECSSDTAASLPCASHSLDEVLFTVSFYKP